MKSSNTATISDLTEDETLLPVVKALLQGVATHVVKGEAGEYQQFRQKLLHVAGALEEDQLPSEVMLTAQSAMNSLRDYGNRIAKRHQGQFSELTAVVKLLLDTLEDLAVASPERMRHLQEIGSQLAAAKEVEELHQKRADLSACLEAVVKEAECQLARTGGHEQDDPVTGLSGRPGAEAALVEASTSEKPLVAVVLLVDRMRMYNRRFGSDVGDKVLNFFAKYAVRSFGSRETLFRWTGPALVMIRPGTPDKIQAEVRRVLEPKLEYDVDTGSRTILLPIVSRWLVLPMMVDPRLLINKIDAYITSQGSGI